MFFENYHAKIRSIVPRKEEKKEVVKEYCTLCLQYEFTQQFAGAMGEFPAACYQALNAGECWGARLPVPVEEVVAVFGEGEDSIQVKNIDTVAAVLKRPNAEDPNPMLTLTMNFGATDAQFIWLKDKLNQTVMVNLDKVQGELFDNDEGKKKGKRK